METAGSRRRGGSGGRGRARERGPACASDDVQRVAANPIDAAAARRGLTDVGFGRYPPQAQFLMACNEGDVGRLKALVDSMAVDDRESLASMWFEGFGPLHSAASSGHMAICKYLVEQLGFDVNSDATNRGSGVTPLHCAVSHEKVIAVRYFLEKGADPNIKDSSNGTTSLHEAVALGYDEIVHLLLAKGANVDEPSDHGAPLVAAAAHGKFSTMKILLAHHADPNKVSWKFGTPLSRTLYATPDRMDESTCLKCMKLLVEAGADVKCTNPETPLAIATTNGLTKCVEYLLEVKTSGDDWKPRLKSNGAKAFQAIKLDSADAVLYSNRSLCHLKCGDANACLSPRPRLHKGHYRRGPSLLSPLSIVCLLLITAPMTEARPVAYTSQSYLCENHDLLARNINGLCTTVQPTPTCCELVVAATENCLCTALKDGATIDIFITKYTSCGGHNANFMEEMKNCSPKLPTKMAPTPQVQTMPIIQSNTSCGEDPNFSEERNNCSSKLPKEISPTPEVEILPRINWGSYVYWVIVIISSVAIMAFVARKLLKDARRVADHTATTELTGTPIMQKRQTADEMIRSQSLDIPIVLEAPFTGAMTRTRLTVLKEKAVGSKESTD